MVRRLLRRPWTPDEDAHLLTMNDQAKSAAWIARHMGRSRSGIAARLKKLRGNHHEAWESEPSKTGTAAASNQL
jgi:hypothetical protein